MPESKRNAWRAWRRCSWVSRRSPDGRGLKLLSTALPARAGRRAARIGRAADGVRLGDVCGRPEAAGEVRWPLHLIRGVLSVFMMATFIFGIQKLSLAKTYALFFVAPLLIAIFSIFMLGERVQSRAVGGDRRWLRGRAFRSPARNRRLGRRRLAMLG